MASLTERSFRMFGIRQAGTESPSREFKPTHSATIRQMQVARVGTAVLLDASRSTVTSDRAVILWQRHTIGALWRQETRVHQST